MKFFTYYIFILINKYIKIIIKLELFKKSSHTLIFIPPKNCKISTNFATLALMLAKIAMFHHSLKFYSFSNLTLTARTWPAMSSLKVPWVVRLDSCIKNKLIIKRMIASQSNCLLVFPGRWRPHTHSSISHTCFFQPKGILHSP